MDEMVLAVQEWVNEKYGDHPGSGRIPENGKTGWSTVYALTRALQIELGIINTANSFGPSTEAAYRAFGEMSFDNIPGTEQGRNIVKILQGACWCKGYNPGAFNGIFGPATERAVIKLQLDAGLPQQDGVVYVHVFKAFLTMDAYVLTLGGDPQIREIQRTLNNNYYKNSGVQPCDGHYQRQTNKALIYAIQTEIDIPANQQTGTVGPATRAGLPNLSVGSSQSNFVRLLKYAIVFNGYTLNNINGTFDNELSNVLREFQLFTLLSQNGNADYQTWMSLLVSTGDPNRRGTASDGITEVTPARAQTLVNEGYVIIGRYLTNVPGGLNKRIQPGELQTIFNAGLSVYPIFQESHANANNFSRNQGYVDYEKAFRAAASYGLPKGTTIYFAVDFDVLGHEISNALIPHFIGLNEAKNDMGNQYNIGIYGPRNACIQVYNRGLADYSFVSGLSTGFSGNLGYPLPNNWSFDQISTITIGSGSGMINIDNNINSGRDSGASFIDDSVEVPGELPDDPNKLSFGQFTIIALGASSLANIEGNTDVTDLNYNLSGYYRKGVYIGTRWAALAGFYPKYFEVYLETNVTQPIGEFVDIIDPVENHVIGVQHMFAVMNGLYGRFKDSVEITDILGWAGDLITVAKNVVMYRDHYEGDLNDRTYAAAYDLIGMVENKPFPDLLFDLDDLLGDIDAYNMAHEARRLNVSIAEIFPSYYTLGQVNTRFTRFFNHRFNGDRAKLLVDSLEVMKGGIEYSIVREELIGHLNLSVGELEAIAIAWYNKILYYVDQGK
ncbi:glycoside hydrolase domain-containing protein [Lederbergia lenta]|uniref:Uncharacterized protein fadG n=1 Tax=Lederbergia lenta TaxID=1467 RepID=A0A2X4WSQ1_LEDLE|nr:glycoside hydrolase domain-containing protein [Lederbergia lenta]MEC2323082.1 DUF1906 domain-containing protein [Lederbergia lenta]SQI62678.1 Uncharacterized protein fadG [Lederbergia lenta]